MRRNRKSTKKQPFNNLTDITINDYANTSVCKERWKKSLINIPKKLKELNIEDGNESDTEQKVRNSKKKKTKSNSEYTGKDYPIDIWFSIAKYIRPEDIGTFAAICKTSHAVTETANFWYNIYNNYCKNSHQLPENMRQKGFLRKYNLKAMVVRTLHHTYKPFADKITACTTFEKHPDILRKRRCIMMWYRKIRTQYLYYFKLQTAGRPTYKNSDQKNLLELLDDISANNEAGCCILQVTCKNLSFVPPVLGMILVSVSLTLSQGFTEHRLQLGFASGIGTYNVRPTGGGDCILVTMDPVINVKVLDWWHPLYPFNDNIEHLLNQD